MSTSSSKKTIMMSLIKLQLRIIHLYEYMKGRYFCRRFHRPILLEMGGYGGVNLFGFRRRAYDNCRCIKCWITWEEER